MTTEYRLRHRHEGVLDDPTFEDFVVERSEPTRWGWPWPTRRWVFVQGTKHSTLAVLERIARQDQASRHQSVTARALSGKVVCTLTLSTSGAIVATP